MQWSVNFKIKHKLFLTLFLTSMTVSVALFVFLQWSFDRGFLNYLNNQEVEYLQSLARVLAEEYESEGDWKFLSQNPHYWFSLQAKTQHHQYPRGPKPHPPFPQGDRIAGGRGMRLPPPHLNTGGIGPRLGLLNADREKIVGGPHPLPEEQALHSITSNGKVIGYLALAPTREIKGTGDLFFVEQQTQTFMYVTLLMGILSLMISFPIASHLLRPINKLINGTLQLIAGRFTTRIPSSTRDELGQLSEYFNTLAMTLEKNEEVRQHWVADISHELRTPLSILQGEIEALQDGVREPHPQVLKTLHEEVTHLVRLVNDLYELSTTDIGGLNYRMIEVDPMGILTSCMEIFEQRLTQKGLDFRCDLQSISPMNMLADPDRLQQLFTNIMENSLRYTIAPGVLEVSIEHKKDVLVVMFNDTAPGVKPEQLPRLFERLYRAEQSRNRRSGGAGLGMSICKNIVDAHQGTIHASESPLGGLSITIELPLQYRLS